MEKTLIIISLILSSISLIILFIYINKVKKYQKMYENSLAKFNNTANVKDKFVDLFARLDEVENTCNETIKRCEDTNEDIAKTIKNIGLVKYNAYDDTENKLSFALALLNDKSSGILLNHVYSKHGSNIYLKNVNEGKVVERISEEEAQAIENALGDNVRPQIEEKAMTRVKSNKINRIRKTK